MKFSDEDINRIADICSQEEIYNFLFKELFNGKPYTVESAKFFVSWLQKGWETGTHFVFIIRNNTNEIVGAMDIKSPSLESGEIGYWADKNSSGFVTNALKELMVTAEKAGYKRLVADILIGNDKSGGVLERVGFVKKGEKELKDKKYYTFEKVIG